jgi:hypothetical protein
MRIMRLKKSTSVGQRQREELKEAIAGRAVEPLGHWEEVRLEGSEQKQHN